MANRLRSRVRRAGGRALRAARSQWPKVRSLRFRTSYWYLHRYAFDLRSGSHTDDSGAVLVTANAADLASMRDTSAELTERKYEQIAERIGSPAITTWLIRDADGTWAGYCHVAYQDFHDLYLNHWVRLRRGRVLFLDDHIFTAHRGRGLHTASVIQRCAILREQGFRQGLVVINDTNVASLRTYGHVGIRPVRRLIWVRAYRIMIQIPWRKARA